MIDINALKQEAFDVVRAIYDVHNELGPGLNESCYQEGLQVELEKRRFLMFVRGLSILIIEEFH